MESVKQCTATKNNHFEQRGQSLFLLRFFIDFDPVLFYYTLFVSLTLKVLWHSFP